MSYSIPLHRNNEDHTHRYNSEDHIHRYTVMDYTLVYALQCEGYGNRWGNYSAQVFLADKLKKDDPDLLSKVIFDSEGGCFFAYAENEDDALKLKSYIDKLVNSINPQALPGTMLQSPASFGG